MKTGRSIAGAIAADGIERNLRQGKVITFHGDRPFIITSRSVQNPDSTHIAPSREDVEVTLKSLMDGQIERISEETDYAAIIILAESIAELARKLQDPSEYL